MNSTQLAWKIRRHAIEMTHVSNGSHIGAALSCADIVAVLYAEIMNIFPGDPLNETRDRFILSKGHAGASVYAALAECGFFPVEELLTHYADGSRLSGHVSHKNVPGVEFSTGSLGHGLSVGTGMAFAAHRDKREHHVYIIMGDGECNEGSVWEGALFAAHHHLSNLVVIIDRNRQQGLGETENILRMEPMEAKWDQFGWHTVCIDGNNHGELKEALRVNHDGKPLCIIANTVKGKGISFMENSLAWHYKSPQGDEYRQAVQELEAAKGR